MMNYRDKPSSQSGNIQRIKLDEINQKGDVIKINTNVRKGGLNTQEDAYPLIKIPSHYRRASGLGKNPTSSTVEVPQ